MDGHLVKPGTPRLTSTTHCHFSYKGKFVRQQAPAREQSYRDQKVYGRKDHAWGVTDLKSEWGDWSKECVEVFLKEILWILIDELNMKHFLSNSQRQNQNRILEHMFHKSFTLSRHRILPPHPTRHTCSLGPHYQFFCICSDWDFVSCCFSFNVCCFDERALVLPG